MTIPDSEKELLLELKAAGNHQLTARLDGLHLKGDVTSTFLRRKLGRRHILIAELTR